MPQTKRAKRIKALETRQRELKELIDACCNLTDEQKKCHGYFPVHDRISEEIKNLKSKIGDMPTQSPKMAPVAVVEISA